ncbi:hypothetical protein BAUCODRAFT_148993 [Baudoinia panamericana UAMH 10762]|uniref:Uncharacterized protein n=1 Tax=Baudoinia panamericana (strain UAMH 10762) TaxID=717646 RepID=M2MTT5_BAUPA|nr:uncharacterized protein BAUCODRAFT_148993 [Baudoinia panamericana UAMH 10762]EMC94948.1 hypothetical protein BAUCODRAFT_148993 [Baudoinia panamericana UAMH 10762]
MQFKLSPSADKLFHRISSELIFHTEQLVILLNKREGVAAMELTVNLHVDGDFGEVMQNSRFVTGVAQMASLAGPSRIRIYQIDFYIQGPRVWDYGAREAPVAEYTVETLLSRRTV